MAKKKGIPKGSIKLPPLCFELSDFSKIIDDQTEKRNWTMVFALRYIHDRILAKRNQLS